MKRKILYTTVFFLIFAGLFFFLNQILFEKQHFGTAKNIPWEERDRVDVMFVGPSHIFYGINPMVLWERSGIAAYNLTTHQQPLWGSRILLDYALSLQKPKLVVLDVIMATNFGRPVIGTDQGTNMTHLALDPVPLSLQKIRNVLECDDISEKGEILFPIILTHTRLQQGLLSYRDFRFALSPQAHLMKGYNYTMNTLPYDRPQPEAVAGQSFPLPEGTEPGLRDFIEYCKEKGLPLLLIKTPIVDNAEMYQQINRIGEIAAEYDVPFLDLNQHFEELEMDFQKDFADRGHLNALGAGKVSAYLADYLNENYDLPDRRGVSGYESWEKSTAHYKNLTELPGLTELSDVLSRSEDPNILMMITAGGASATESCLPDTVVDQLNALGLEKFPICGNAAYAAVLNQGKHPLELLSTKQNVDTDFLSEDVHFYLHASKDAPDGEKRMANINIDSGGDILMEPGILVVTFDRDTMQKIDAVKFLVADSFKASREF